MNKGEDGARKFYYYFRDEKLRPLITVCLLENDGKFHRGIAICSPRDFPRKAEGRNIALGRARQAQKKGKTDINSVSTRDETIFVFSLVDNLEHFPFEEVTDKYAAVYKSSFYVKLTDFEKVLMTKPGKGE